MIPVDPPEISSLTQGHHAMDQVAHPDSDVDMTSPQPSAEEDRLSLRRWLATAKRGDIMKARLAQDGYFSPAILKSRLDGAAVLFLDPLPEWLMRAMSSKRDLPSAFSETFAARQDEKDLIENLIFETWHDSHLRHTKTGSSSSEEDRLSLRQWLATDKRGDDIKARLARDGNFSPAILKFRLDAAAAYYDRDPLPQWLKQAMSSKYDLPSAFSETFAARQDEKDLIENLIFETWHGKHTAKFSSEWKAKSLHDAFTAPYLGDAPARFCNSLRDGYIRWYRPTMHYGRIIATVQSSATGKSRLYYEIGETSIPAFVLCFRKFDDGDLIDPSQGWPPGDRPLVHYFKPHSIFTSEEIAAAFLGQLYKALAKSARDGINCFSHLSPSLDVDPRNEFLEGVCREARETLVTLKTVSRGHKTSAAWCEDLFRRYVEEHADVLGRKLQGRTRYPGADFLLVIDECAHLDKLGAQEKTPGNADWASFLTGLRRIVEAGDQIGASSRFWFILIDTHWATLYPISPKQAASARLFDGSRHGVALPPWIDLGFDVNKPNQPPTTPREGLSLDWLKKFGRPYWCQLDTSLVLSEAAAKLICGKLDSYNIDHVIAAMSRRIHLPLTNDFASTAFQRTAVEKHMRYMRSIGWEDGMVQTAAPSEPVLSIAAANALLAHRAIYSNVVKIFLEHVLMREHLVDRGRLGEALASLVLVIARDAATCNWSNGFEYRNNNFTTAERFVQPVTAMKFIEHLLPELQPKHKEKFTTFGDRAWINFTHFGVLPHILSGTIPVALLVDAWCRGVAFQCAKNQPIYDLLIPMYLGDLDDTFDRAKLSYVVIQVKARVAATGKGDSGSLTGPMICMESAGVHKPAYIALLMDLENLAAFEGSGSKVHVEFETAVVPTITDASINLHYESQESPRWVFHARGLKENTYPFLAKFGAEKLYKALYPRVRADDEAEGREVVRSAATQWSEAMDNVLTT